MTGTHDDSKLTPVAVLHGYKPDLAVKPWWCWHLHQEAGWLIYGCAALVSRSASRKESTGRVASMGHVGWHLQLSASCSNQNVLLIPPALRASGWCIRQVRPPCQGSAGQAVGCLEWLLLLLHSVTHSHWVAAPI